jgi:hypothetical protein
MTLRGRIDALCSAFASDVFAALGRASLDELHALASRGKTGGAKTKTKATKARAEPRAKATKAAKVGPSALPSRKSVPPSAEAASAALEFFAARGARGATASQVLAHLRSNGIDEDVVQSLVARGVIRDAGIRRATGKGTSAVYVLEKGRGLTEVS